MPASRFLSLLRGSSSHGHKKPYAYPLSIVFGKAEPVLSIEPALSPTNREAHEITKETKRKNDIIKRFKPALMPHYFRHNYATLLFEAGVEPLIAMKIPGHTDYQTTANIYTHLKSEMLKKSSVDMQEVFRKKQEVKGAMANAKN